MRVSPRRSVFRVGALCQSQGMELAELQAFDRWHDEQGGLVSVSEEDETRTLPAAKEKKRRKLEKELCHKEKELAEMEVLLAPVRKVEALWRESR